MNGPLIVICLVLLAMQAAMPARLAFLPLLLAAIHTPYTADFGGFTVARLVIVVGLLRAGVGNLIKFGNSEPLDRWMMVFSAIALFSAIGHEALFSNPIIFRAGLVLNVLGTYLYARAYLASGPDPVLERLAKGLVIALAPFALMMLLEKQSGINPYAELGAQNEVSLVRDGKIRAQGPFGTPILAGTVGACCVPLFFPLWRSRRRLAAAGLTCCLAITYSSASSGPISTVLLGIGAITLWKVRPHMRQIQIATLCILTILHLIKERPIWYLMALMDFVGGSTGWHRAYLIDVGVKRMGEWWLIGTDRTGHWLPYALPTSVPGLYQCDLTNYYLHLGVIGGIPLLFCLLAIQWTSFKKLGRRILEMRRLGDPREFNLWCVGATLFAHGITFLSISYFDQMYVLFWIVIGALPAILNLSDYGRMDPVAVSDAGSMREHSGAPQPNL